jgi:NitT/TauT family transport system ATP-binding protein
MSGLAVQLAGVRRVFDDGLVALEGVDLDVPAGQFVALLGPSGCGKSTLLRLVAGLDRPTAGIVEPEAVAPGQLAYVFQDPHLLPWRTVGDNVALPLELAAGASAGADAVASALAGVELAGWEGRYPAQLSGGMRMRVSLARALVTDPQLLLLDEPFGALDELTRLRLDERLRALWQERRPTVLFVTHSITEAVLLAERVVVLSPRPGRIVADLTLDLPAERTRASRTDPAFVACAERLFAALEEAGA